MDLDLEVFARYIGAVEEQIQKENEEMDKQRDSEAEEKQKQVLRDRLPK